VLINVEGHFVPAGLARDLMRPHAVLARVRGRKAWRSLGLAALRTEAHSANNRPTARRKDAGEVRPPPNSRLTSALRKGRCVTISLCISNHDWELWP
jgi:hypothetical protein